MAFDGVFYYFVYFWVILVILLRDFLLLRQLFLNLAPLWSLLSFLAQLIARVVLTHQSCTLV